MVYGSAYNLKTEIGEYDQCGLSDSDPRPTVVGAFAKQIKYPCPIRHRETGNYRIIVQIGCSQFIDEALALPLPDPSDMLMPIVEQLPPNIRNMEILRMARRQ